MSVLVPDEREKIVTKISFQTKKEELEQRAYAEEAEALLLKAGGKRKRRRTAAAPGTSIAPAASASAVESTGSSEYSEASQIEEQRLDYDAGMISFFLAIFS